MALWSGGYIGGTFAVRNGPPLTMSFYRFVIGAVLMTAIALATRASWPRDRASWLRLAVIGVLMNTVQFTGVYLGMDSGVSAGLTSLIICSSPMVVAVLAVPLLGERVSARQALGTALGVAGVLVAVSGNLDLEHLAGVALVLLGMAGMVGGTLVQSRHGARVDLRAGLAIQLTAAAIVQLPFTILHAGGLDGLILSLTTPALLSLGWIAIVNSLAGLGVFYTLIRRTSAGTASSYLYLVPSVTALLGWPLLGQPLTVATLTGLAVSLGGVALFVLGGRRDARRRLTETPAAARPRR